MALENQVANELTTVVGIRHEIGYDKERYWLDDTIRYLSDKVNSGDKVMLEIPEHPLTKFFYRETPRRTGMFMGELCDFLQSRGCEIVPGEDKERWGTEDYHEYRVRDNEAFIPKLKEVKPKFFLVGYKHLGYLQSQVPELSYVNLVDEEEDLKRSPWLKEF